MAYTPIFNTDTIADMEQLKSLSTHVVTILDKETSILTTDKSLTVANANLLNGLYANIVSAMNNIITPA